MEASDMLDVLHFFFEDEMRGIAPEMIESHAKMRQAVYQDMYGVPYAYMPIKSSDEGVRDFTGSLDDEFSNEPIVPFDPKKAPVKAYFPPTDFDPDSYNPFGKVLDSPIG